MIIEIYLHLNTVWFLFFFLLNECIMTSYERQPKDADTFSPAEEVLMMIFLAECKLMNIG